MFDDPGEAMRTKALADLRHITSELKALEQKQDQLITQALVAGATQGAIADALGVKQPAANKRITARGLRP